MLLIMSLVQIYQCLCDETRLRILNLLHEGELCVCHIQDILGEPQVKISKHPRLSARPWNGGSEKRTPIG